MRVTPEFRQRPATERWRRRVLAVAWVIVVGAALAGCDRCGDFSVLGSSMVCRQEAPKPQ